MIWYRDRLCVVGPLSRCLADPMFPKKHRGSSQHRSSTRDAYRLRTIYELITSRTYQAPYYWYSCLYEHNI